MIITTTWDENDEVYLHTGYAYIAGFPFRYSVESHNIEVTDWDKEQIKKAFDAQAYSILPTAGTVQ